MKNVLNIVFTFGVEEFKSFWYSNGKYRSKYYVSQLSSYIYAYQLGNSILPPKNIKKVEKLQKLSKLGLF